MALPETPLTRGEEYLAKTAGQDTALPEVPLTRMEQYLAKIAGQDVALPDAPLTRIEQYLGYIAENGGGSSITVDTDLSSTSTNPVQNKAVWAGLDGYTDIEVTSPSELEESAISGGRYKLIGISDPEATTPMWMYARLDGQYSDDDVKFVIFGGRTIIGDPYESDSWVLTNHSLFPLIGSTTNVKPKEVADAVRAGRSISITHVDSDFGEIVQNSWFIAGGSVVASAIVYVPFLNNFIVYIMYAPQDSNLTSDWSNTVRIVNTTAIN